MVACFRITITSAAVRAFLGGVAGADVVQVMVADDDGRDEGDHHAEKCKGEFTGEWFVLRHAQVGLFERQNVSDPVEIPAKQVHVRKQDQCNNARAFETGRVDQHGNIENNGKGHKRAQYRRARNEQ